MYSGSLREANADAVSLPSSSVASTRTLASSPPQRGHARGIKSSFICILSAKSLSENNLHLGVYWMSTIAANMG